jgi:hypothetical protein
LLPVAYSQRPKGVRVSTIEKMMAKMIITQAERGRPSGREAKTAKNPVLPTASCPRSSLVMFCPLSSTSVRPRAT